MLNNLLGRYWNAAYAEGKEGRDHDTVDAVAQRILTEIHAEIERQLAEKQAEIDRLMLEFCPEEITQDQIETWASNQKPSTDHT